MKPQNSNPGRLRTALRLAWERYCHALALNGIALKDGNYAAAVRWATATRTWADRHSRLRLLVQS